jgi:hypothetical protein
LAFDLEAKRPIEMKVQSQGGNKYTFDFGGGPETIVMDGTDSARPERHPSFSEAGSAGHVLTALIYRKVPTLIFHTLALRLNMVQLRQRTIFGVGFPNQCRILPMFPGFYVFDQDLKALPEEMV